MKGNKLLKYNKMIFEKDKNHISKIFLLKLQLFYNALTLNKKLY